MEEHVNSVERFHGTLSSQTEWLSTAEKRLRALKKPSKIYDGIQTQIRGLKVVMNVLVHVPLCSNSGRINKLVEVAN